MNWRHLRAFVWLRWRLAVNQWRRAGAFHTFLMMVMTFGAVATAVPLFIGCFIVGEHAIPKATPDHLLYLGDALVVTFLFFWSVGLVTELQRSDPLSLSKFMHLPVSVKGVFLINYFSSLFRLSLVVYVPAMLGFCLALIHVKGLSLLPALPLLAAFFLMITALTYQFQGWLAAMMNNPRRRRTVVVVTTTVFVLIFQLPNLLNHFSLWGGGNVVKRENLESMASVVRIVNMILPIGWLPVGIKTAAEGRILPPILCLAGMSLIGAASLWRAYRTTVGMYQGQPTNRTDHAPARVEASDPESPPPSPELRKRGNLLEAQLTGLSEPVAVIALGSFRALLRSPEAKMMLLSSVIMSAIFGSMLFKGNLTVPETLRPLTAAGGMVFVLLGAIQMMGNQFGFDRDGFRVFVLCAARRRDILLGKNLAFAPIALGMGAVMLIILQVVCPLRPDHLLAMIPQYISMFLLFCMFANLLSIYAPVHIAAGSLKPRNPKLGTVFVQMAMFTVLFPLTQGAALLPLGAEILLRLLGWIDKAPVCLILAVVECAAVVLIYRVALEWQGRLFQDREKKILESVTKPAS